MQARVRTSIGQCPAALDSQTRVFHAAGCRSEAAPGQLFLGAVLEFQKRRSGKLNARHGPLAQRQAMGDPRVFSNRQQLVLVTLLCVLAAPAMAIAQSSELQSLLDELSAAAVLTPEQGRAALQKFAQLKLSPGTLPPADRERALQVELLGNLAIGDAGRAAERAAELFSDAKAPQAVLDRALLAAVAAGDAQLGEQIAERRAKFVKPDEHRAIARARMAFTRVGQKAPAARLEVLGTDYAPATDGKVFALYFWTLLRPPAAEQSRGATALFEAFKSDPDVRFIGVNADSAARGDAARKFADENGYLWPQVYEQQSIKAPITHVAYDAPFSPCIIVIDSYGFLRCVADPADAAAAYALRSAAAEARNEYRPVPARTKAGVPAEFTPRASAPPPKSATSAAGGAGKSASSGGAGAGDKPSGGAASQGELSSNDEAEAKLRQARTYLRTGKRSDAKRMFEEITRDYPGTRQAKEAQEYLDAWPR